MLIECDVDGGVGLMWFDLSCFLFDDDVDVGVDVDVDVGVYVDLGLV